MPVLCRAVTLHRTLYFASWQAPARTYASAEAAVLQRCSTSDLARPQLTGRSHAAAAAGGASGGGGGGADAELRHFIEEMAERALLGLGDADRMFPTTLDQMYEAFSEDMPGRIML